MFRRAISAAAVFSFVLVVAAWLSPIWWVRAQIDAQKETASNLRTLGTGLDNYVKEKGMVPTVTDCNGLRQALVPRYVGARMFDSICRDGWGNRLAMNYSRSGATAPPDVFAGTHTTYTPRYLGLAAEAYAKEHGVFPQVTDCQHLREALVPHYVTASSFERICNDRSAAPQPGFVIASAGRDGSFAPSTRELFTVHGKPFLQPSLERELSINGSWHEMDYVWIRPEGFVALAWDGQEERYDYGRAPSWTTTVRWLVTSLWIGLMIVLVGLKWRET